MLHKLSQLSRYIVTARVSKYRLFVWLPQPILADSATIVIARDDDLTFGILHSRFHEMWSLGLCTWLGVGNDPRYTPTTTFETFPFPEGLTPTFWRNSLIRIAGQSASSLRGSSLMNYGTIGSIQKVSCASSGRWCQVIPIVCCQRMPKLPRFSRSVR